MKQIFTVRIEDTNPVHTRVTVFNYGGSAGTLTINTSDVPEFVKRIMGGVSVNQQMENVSGTVVGAVIERL